MRDTSCHAKLLAFVRSAGTRGVTRQQIAKHVRLHDRTCYDHLKALIADEALCMRIDHDDTRYGRRRVARYTVPDAEAPYVSQPFIHPIRRAFLENRPLPERAA